MASKIAFSAVFCESYLENRISNFNFSRLTDRFLNVNIVYIKIVA